MIVSLIGPTNLEKLSSILGVSIDEIKEITTKVGEILAKTDCKVRVIFNYKGTLQLAGDAYKRKGGKLEMLYAEDESDWYCNIYFKHLKKADIKKNLKNWHDLLLSLVKDSDIVLCLGLSAGVFTELGYMKWNYQEKKGKVKALIGIKELIRSEAFPPEIAIDSVGGMSKVISVNELEKVLISYQKST